MSATPAARARSGGSRRAPPTADRRTAASSSSASPRAAISARSASARPPGSVNRHVHRPPRLERRPALAAGCRLRRRSRPAETRAAPERESRPARRWGRAGSRGNNSRDSLGVEAPRFRLRWPAGHANREIWMKGRNALVKALLLVISFAGPERRTERSLVRPGATAGQRPRPPARPRPATLHRPRRRWLDAAARLRDPPPAGYPPPPAGYNQPPAGYNQPPPGYYPPAARLLPAPARLLPAAGRLRQGGHTVLAPRVSGAAVSRDPLPPE